MTAFLVPGALDQLTGGYLFDRHVVEGLRATGRAVDAIELPGSFPEPDAAARASLSVAYVLGRWHRFAKSGFRKQPTDGLEAQLGLLIGPAT